MAWKVVEVKSGKVVVQGHLRGPELEFPNRIKESASLSVDGKNAKVDSWAVEERDDIVRVMLADASTKEKSDDKPAKGPSTD